MLSWRSRSELGPESLGGTDLLHARRRPVVTAVVGCVYQARVATMWWVGGKASVTVLSRSTRF